jgi:hypothetical protein
LENLLKPTFKIENRGIMSETKVITCDVCGKAENVDKWNSLTNWGWIRMDTKVNNSKDDGSVASIDVCDKCYKAVVKVGLDNLIKEFAELLKTK